MEPITVTILDKTDKFAFLGGEVTTQGGGGDDITLYLPTFFNL